MLERLGVQNEWRDKSKLAFAKLQRMLDPSFKFDFADPATAGSQSPAPPPPPTPAPPAGRPGSPDPDAERARSEADRPAADRPRAPDSVARPERLELYLSRYRRYGRCRVAAKPLARIRPES